MKTYLLRYLVPVLLFVPFIVRSENGLIRAENDGPVASNIPLNEVSVRAFRYFRKGWPAINNEVWYRTEKEYIVCFRNDSHHNKAFFDLRGNFLYSIEYYRGEDIPAHLAGMMRNKYPDYRIAGMTEVSGRLKTIRYINIENPSFIKTLSLIDEKLEVYEELINANGVLD